MWNTYKKYIEENEEIRCWFKVSSNRKKVWNIQLWLIEEFKKICKKHGLKYYADSGTLLWAIRHKWFIPWDDDTDFAMFRKDYDKFMEIAPKELPKNLVLQWNYHNWMCAKLRNENTVATDTIDKDKDYLWGISLDIFPLDYMSKYKIINIIRLYVLTFTRWILISLKNKESIMKNTCIRKRYFSYVFRFLFRCFDFNKIFKIHDNFRKKTIFKDESHVGYLWWGCFLSYNVKDFKQFQELDFESIKICIPLWYDNVLKTVYWDYMKPEIYPRHDHLFSVEKWYKELTKNWEIDNSQLFSI